MEAGLNKHKVALYICSRKDGTDKPSFFKKKETKEPKHTRKPSKDQWSRVSNITRLVDFSWKVNFTDGTNEVLKWPPYWTRLSWEMKPEDHCNLTKEKVNQGYDKLICSKDDKAILSQAVNL